MSAIAPIILLIITASLMWLYGWRLVLAITVSVIAIPFIVIPAVAIYEKVVVGKEAPLGDAFSIAGLFAFFGWFLYLLFVAPLHAGLKALGLYLPIFFPLAVASVSTVIFFLLAEQRIPLWGWGLVVLCSYLHAWIILWIMGNP